MNTSKWDRDPKGAQTDVTKLTTTESKYQPEGIYMLRGEKPEDF